MVLTCDVCNGNARPIDKHYFARKSRELRERRNAEGLCQLGSSHGKRVHGSLCEACYRARQAREENRQPPTDEEKGRRAETARKRYEARKKNGICLFSAKHGKATHGLLCKKCHTVRHAIYERRKDRLNANRNERKDAINAKRRIRRARKKIVITCIVGKHHGPVVSGHWCASCIERRQAAAKRVLERKKAQEKQEAQRAQSERRTKKEQIAEAIARANKTGSLDSTGLLDILT